MFNSWKSSLIIFICVVSSLFVFILPICGFLFRCGCTWIWTDAASHCNIYDPTPPNCPWCVYHGVIGLLAGSVIFFLQIFISSVALILTGRTLLACIAGVTALFPISILIGWVTRLF